MQKRIWKLTTPRILPRLPPLFANQEPHEFYRVSRDRPWTAESAVNPARIQSGQARLNSGCVSADNLSHIKRPIHEFVGSPDNVAYGIANLFEDKLAANPTDIRLLTVGRHFRMDAGNKIVIGRDNSENKVLMELAPHGYHLFMPHSFPGPVALLSGEPAQEIRQTIGRLIITYSKQVPGRSYLIRYGNEIFDPGEPLPINASNLRRVGADG
jgi:hypothetical protein